MRAILPLCIAITLLVLAFLGDAAINDAKDRVLQLSIRPRIALGPADIAILIRLQPADSDRTLRVWTDGETFSRSSAWTIDGAMSRKLYDVEWRRVFVGEYDVIASVSNALGEIRASDTQRVTLMGH